MQTFSYSARVGAEELKLVLLGLSLAEHALAACAEVQRACRSQNEALGRQRKRLTSQRLRLAARERESEREYASLCESLAVGAG